MKHDERGLTLVEVLATLTIFSIVSLIIWSIFFQGFNFSQKSVSENFMIQETNILIANLTKIHQTSSEYQILSTGVNNCEITVSSKKKDVIQPNKIFNHSEICFEFVLSIKNKAIGSDPNKIVPNENDVSITLTASDKHNPNNKVTMKSYLYKLKGVGY
ncbi:prepilin-type N-terminal cleavage/methylation domain-containing protein [Paenibacillus sp. BSR1-1]|uniref:prepilin-type N-terminal cleavage/methylation domain-containing protein n=1 Tax=Paenibacillus sp. BSR1-1 TaxID=3020845 RepID=UPI0025B094E6|nr:prepilin-type N-terminal cleavage/methylation domain-containing protein [Paenibacillus sp. BSR1-1]MDN3018502.1 prepilin-type N-terminal cleavage/methylation domain-containing protein [Paenibacillus sp. BSR1-1]